MQAAYPIMLPKVQSKREVMSQLSAASSVGGVEVFDTDKIDKIRPGAAMDQVCR